MAEKRRGGKPTDVLSVSLFLLEHSHDDRINKNMCSKGAIERLSENGYGPPPDSFVAKKQKVYFPFSMTTEEFTSKLVEIYPKLQNQCYLLMRADKSNNLRYLDIANSSYNPKEIYNSNLGQGRLYIRFAAETEIKALQSAIVTPVNCMMPPPPKLRRIMPKFREIRPKPSSSMFPNSVSNSAETLPVPAQNVGVSQATTADENHHSLPKSTDTTSNNTGTIFPAADNDSDAESIIGRLLENNELGIKVISGLFQRLGSDLKNLSTNNASMLSSTNANGTSATLHNNLQTSILNQSTPTTQQPENQMTALGNLSSTTLHQLDPVNQVHSLISSQPDFPETHMLAQNSLSGNTNIPPVLSSTRNIPQTTMVFAPDQQPYTQDPTGTDGINLLLQAHETYQNNFAEDFLLPLTSYIEGNDEQDRRNSQLVASEALQNGLIEMDIPVLMRFVGDKILEKIAANGYVDIFPELSKMESIFLRIQSASQYTVIRSVRLRPVGELKEFLDNLDREFMKRFEHFTWLNLQQSSLCSVVATTLAKMLPSFEELEELDLSDAGLDEVDVENVLKALKSCKLKILVLSKNKVGNRGATALAKMLPSLELLEKLHLFDVGLDEIDVEKVLKALKSYKLKELYLDNNKVGARGATALAEMLPSHKLLEKLYLFSVGFDEDDVEKVILALKSCKRLKILDLGNNKVGTRGATALAKMFSSFELLEKLHLFDAGLDEVDVENVLKALKSSKKLKELYLDNNKVGARGATALAKMLPSLELLEKLHLFSVGLDEADVEKILKTLKSCKKLKILDLGNNKVGARGATALAKMLPSFSYFQLLILRDVSLDEEVKTKLRATISLCEIEIIW